MNKHGFTDHQHRIAMEQWHSDDSSPGCSTLEYLAAAALTGLLANPENSKAMPLVKAAGDTPDECVARSAVAFAIATIKALYPEPPAV